jgi:hypothetical protein
MCGLVIPTFEIVIKGLYSFRCDTGRQLTADKFYIGKYHEYYYVNHYPANVENTVSS